ncbi:arginine--tRNA ligase [Candidatus Uhrbacteria bacterium]|jgi:arginyl-tRNA synthetase|nr:arginine--tRNA ligase [Candidatus Uhrbacteria bacterium]
MDQKYAYTRARLEVLKALKGAIGKTYSPTFEELEVPPQPEFGDAAFPCFTLAKGLKRNPAEIATELAAKIGPKGMIKKISSRGPYVNFFFDMEVYGAEVLSEIVVRGDKFGQSSVGEGRRVMVEYANFNTHKEVHIGHLRNMVVGHMSINLLRATGHNVIATSYINDLGNNVARCLWAMNKFHEHEAPEKGDEINFLGRVYSEATAAAEDNDEAREEISEIQKALESKKGQWSKLWKQTRQWSIDAIYRIFGEMGIPVDVQYYESDLLDDTARLVKQLLDTKIAEISDGATIVDLEDEGLGVNLLRKTDGTYLYNGKDIALAERKAQDHDIDRSLIVVDKRQSLAMNQLFTTLKKMGMDIPYEHLSYGFVTLPDGAMSSRKGNIVRFEELRDTILEAATKETRERHNDWSEKEVRDTAMGIGHAAMIYAMAKQDSAKDIVFNIDEAIAFEGMSGPYLLYSISRIESLMNSAKVKPNVDGSVIDSPEARDLVNMLAKYPETVLDSASFMRLADVPQYAFELAQSFSSYYAAHRVIDDENPEVTAARLALVGAVLVTLKNALGIMNIKPVTHM